MLSCSFCGKGFKGDPKTVLRCTDCKELVYCTKFCCQNDMSKWHGKECEAKLKERIDYAETKSPFIKEGRVIKGTEVAIGKDPEIRNYAITPKTLERDFIQVPVPGTESPAISSSEKCEAVLVKNKLTSQYFELRIYSFKNLKLISKNALTQMEREVCLRQRLIHENIQRLYSYTKDEENLYCLLEYVAGATLRQRINAKHYFTEPQAFVLFAQVCGVLHFLHKNGYVHRDIRPGTMIVAEDKLVKMTDFEFCTNHPEDLYKLIDGFIGH